MSRFYGAISVEIEATDEDAAQEILDAAMTSASRMSGMVDVSKVGLLEGLEEEERFPGEFPEPPEDFEYDESGDLLDHDDEEDGF